MAKAEVTLDNFSAELDKTIKRMVTDEEFAAEVLIGKPEGNPVTLGPRVKSATDWVNDMVEGAKARASNWLKNTKNPKKDPKAAALAAKGKYDSNMRKALDEKRYEKGIAAYDESARDAVIDAVGTSGFSEGIERHRAKAVSKVTKLQPLVTALAKTLDAMPIDTDAQREAKMIAAKRGMQDIGKKMRGG